MLQYRSICLQICLLFILNQNVIKTQEDEYEEGLSEADAYEETDHPDYTKYYSTDSSTPLVAGSNNVGFASPIEFSSFFGPEFGESGRQEVAKKVKNPFLPQEEAKTTGFVSASDFPSFFSGNEENHFPKDYFDEAQKTQQKEGEEETNNAPYEIPPGPNYISHQLPNIKEVADYSTDVEHIKPRIKSRDKPKQDKEYRNTKLEDTKYQISDDYYEPKNVDYSTGKSSATVSQKSPTPSPYEKYSFQPATEGSFESKYLNGLISTVAPFNPAYSKLAPTPSTVLFEESPSDVVFSQLKGNNCKKIQKNVEKKDYETGKLQENAMDCYVCEDPNTQSQSTHCSYSSEPDAKNDYSGRSLRYSTPSKHQNEDGFRYKRYSGDDFSADPYEYIKKRSQKEEKIQEDESRAEYETPDYYNVEDVEKSFSEAQSEQLKQDPKNCIKEEKSGMTCTICKDPKTGGNFEQCSYTSAPQEQKYAYSAEKNFNSNDEPEEGSESKSQPQKEQLNSDKIKKKPKQELAGTSTENPNKYENFQGFDSKKLNEYNEHKRKYAPKRKQQKKPKEEQFEEESSPEHETEYLYKNPEYDSAKEFATGAPPSKKPTKLVDDEPYGIPKHFAESTNTKERTADEENEEEEEAEEEDPSKQEPYKEIDEYHFKLFPEFNHEETQQVATQSEPGEETNRKDVEEVLAEFSKKDRSECKKAEKKGMTCYLCVDKNGIQHEECMYVSESKPQATHLAYHEVKQIKTPEKEVKIEPDNKRKHFFKKVVSTTTVSPFTFESAASDEIETKIRYEKPSKKGKKSRQGETEKYFDEDDRVQDEEDEPKAKSSRQQEHERYFDDDERIEDEEDEPKAKNSRQQKKKKHFDDSDRIQDEGDEPKVNTPTEFDGKGSEGAYSAETRPVYSKVLGVSLPKYMVEKSEFEKEFDAFAGPF